jgi:hypothetical protein
MYWNTSTNDKIDQIQFGHSKELLEKYHRIHESKYKLRKQGHLSNFSALLANKTKYFDINKNNKLIYDYASECNKSLPEGISSTNFKY